MKTILVDDMLLDLQLFELKCADMPDFEIVGKFTDPNAAIEYAAGHVVDFALLDIDMPGMDGIHLAQALRRLRSDIIIVFATAHPKFAVEALKMKADYIIFKPFDREDIADVMERAKLLRRRQCKRIHFHTFGAFDMLVDGEPVHFPLRQGQGADGLVRVSGRAAGVHSRDRGKPMGERTPTAPATAAPSRSWQTPCGTMARRRCSCAAGGACGCGWTWRTRIFRHS